MAKNIINRTEKQQMSMILRSQLVYDYEHVIRTPMIENLKKSGYHVNCSTTGWYSEHFKFKFDYARSGAVRVSYINSDGVQSVVFNSSEWQLILHDTWDRCQSIDEKRREERIRAKREAEEIRFKHAVEAQVYEILERERKREEAQRRAVEIKRSSAI